MSKVKSEIRDLVKEYRAKDAKREADLGEYRNEDGDVASEDLRDYDERRFDLALEADGDLSDLLAELEALAGPALAVGDAVIVPTDITTVSGGFVGYVGEVTAQVIALEDKDGDILVKAQDMGQFVDPAKVKLVK